MKEKYIKDIYTFLKKYTTKRKVLDCGAAGEEGVTDDSPYWIHGVIADNSSYVLGFDIEKNTVKRLQEKGHNIIYGDCENLELETKEKFDVVFAGELIEHLTKPGDFLEGLKKYLKKEEGRLILTTPNAFSFYRNMGNLVGLTEENPQHVLVQNKKTLEQLLQRHGYTVLEVHFFTNPSFYDVKRMRTLRKILKIPTELLFRLRPQLAHQILIIAKY